VKIKNIDEIAANRLGIPGAKDVSVRLLIGPEDGAVNFVMMLLALAPGGHTPDHSHPWEEEIFVRGGEGTLSTQEGKKTIRAGDVLYFNPNEPHQFVNTSAGSLECICVIPRRK